MIDFRYHVVSLVSVFLALAVGLVLGAGPLQNSLGDALKLQVQQLRQDRDQLNADLATANHGIDERDGFLSAVSGRLAADALRGESVVLVRLPGADTSVATELERRIQAAGGTVTGRVDVKNEWVDPDKSASRVQAVSDLLATANSSVSIPATASADEALPQLLTRAVLTSVTLDTGIADPTGQSLLTGLRKANLVSISGGVTRRASEAVVLAPAVASATVNNTVTPSVDANQAAVQQTAWTLLLGALRSGGDGSVVVGPASSATKGGVLAIVRSSSTLVKTISTVDTGGTAMGDLTTVFALREQRDGGVGAYGFGAGAQQILPANATATSS